MGTAKNGRDQRASSPQGRLTRRGFLGTTAVAAPLLLAHSQALGYAANEQLQVAVVGVGGRGSGFVPDKGWSSVREQMGARIAALCDVNKKKAAEPFTLQPDVPKFEDFRVMIDQMGSKLDAVVVATPDHNHAPPSACALRAGLHVFCEKGLTRTIHEARTLARLTVEKKRSTQMGNQAGYNVSVIENVWAGRLGEIQSIHMWGGGGAGPRKAPSGTHEVPDYLNWDLWLGPAAFRPYHPEWMSHSMWRDFSCGHPGWWGAHLWATLFKTMKLDTLWPIDQKPPAAGAKTIKVTAECCEVCDLTFPSSSIVHWDIPARMNMPPIRISWYAGGREAEKRRRDYLRELFAKHPQWGNIDDKRWGNWVGNLWVGTEGIMYTFGHGDTTVAMFPEDKFKNLDASPQSLPRPLPGGFLRGWADGIKKGTPTMSGFNSFSGPFTEWYLLANIATQFPDKTLEFDPVTCRIVNNEQADQKIRPPYREGWKL